MKAAHQSPHVLFNDTVSFHERIFAEDVQAYYDDFLKKRRHCIAYFLLRPHYTQKIELLKKLALTEKLITYQKTHNELLGETVVLEDNRLKMARRLHQEQVIAFTDLENAREKMLDKYQILEVAKKELTHLDLNKREIISKVQELNIRMIEDSIRYKGELLDAFRLFYSKVKEWENVHILRAPVDGKAFFADYWANGQTVAQNDEMMSILPDDERVFGIAKISFDRSGEVEPGQRVNISLQSFLAEEHGVITGRVKNISPIPNERTYRVMVELPAGLTTSYGHKIPFKPELQGEAEIITKNTRIIQKIFCKLKRASEKI